MRATFRGVTVEADGRLLVLPTAQVERVVRVKIEDVQTVEGHETIAFDGRAVALVHLTDALELPLADHKGMSPAGGSGSSRLSRRVCR